MLAKERFGEFLENDIYLFDLDKNTKEELKTIKQKLDSYNLKFNKEELNLYDTIIVEGSYSMSNYAKEQSNYLDSIIYSNDELNQKLVSAANDLNIEPHKGLIHCSDVFYKENNNKPRNKFRGFAYYSFSIKLSAHIMPSMAAILAGTSSATAPTTSSTV